MKNTVSITLAALLISAFSADKPKVGVDVKGMNGKIKPYHNFYDYANGNWLKNNPIPNDEARWGSFNVLADNNSKILHAILQNSLTANAAKGQPMHTIKSFYILAKDTNAINTQRYESLSRLISNIMLIQNTNDLVLQIAQLQKIGVRTAFSIEVSQDVKNSSIYAPYLSQDGLGLPDKEYYTKADERNVLIRNKYVELINYSFDDLQQDVEAKGINWENKPENMGLTLLAFESLLAKNMMSKVEMRDMEKQYNPYFLPQLTKTYSTINWDAYFKELNLSITSNQQVIVMQPEYFATLNQILTTDINTWKYYLTWRLLLATTTYLHDELVTAGFNFYGTTLTGAKAQKPRWKRIINQANALIGELVAQEYVKVAFTPESKKRVSEMVEYMRQAYSQRIAKLDWMSETTKQKAQEKLNSFTKKLGYPDKWTDFSALSIPNNYFVYWYFNASTFWFNKNIEKLGKMVDKSEWEMLPQTVNAYYNPVNNEIVFPAAIMQPPFYNANADDAVNYGAIGAVIGHEFSHGFDDQGSKYDANGNLNNWWTDQDRINFDIRTKKLVAQYNTFEPVKGAFVNGELTLGENIADLAGLTVAFDAYQRSLQGKPRTKIDGLTPEQRFFVGFAQVWRTNARDEFLRQQVVTDPHAPAKYRVLGTLGNIPEFYSAFGVQNSHSMWIDEVRRVKIW